MRQLTRPSGTRGDGEVGGRPGGVARPSLVDRGLVAGCGVAAALPVIVLAVHALAIGWVPLGDRADYAVRSFDVFSGRTPLVGPWSSGASIAAGAVTYSPGPLLFWLLAVPARFLEARSLQVTAGLVNVASVIGVVGLALRRGGRPLMFAAAIALPLMLASLPADVYSDIWNSSAPLLPLTLLVFLAWSLGCGEYRLLPLAVLVASFVVQCHLTFVVPALGALAVGVVGLFAAPRFRPRRGRMGRGALRDRRRSMRRWLAAAGLVALVCWLPPLIDQATNRPGNLALLARAAASSEPTLGFEAGWHALVHAVGVLPWWLRDPPTPLGRVADLVQPPPALAVGSAGLVVGGLVAVVLAGWRRRRVDVWAAGALGLVLCAGVAIDAASTPKKAVLTVDYTLRWASPAGMCVWLLLGWSLAALLLRGSRQVGARLTALGAIAAAVTAGAIGGIVAAGADPAPRPYRQMREINNRLNRQIPARGVTLVEARGVGGAAFSSGIIYSLRRAGKAVVSPGAGKILGSAYEPGGYERVVRVDVYKPRRERGRKPGRRIARLSFKQPNPTPLREIVEVTLLAAPHH